MDQPLRPLCRHLHVRPRHLARGGLGAEEALQHLVGLAQPARELAHHADGDLGVPLEELIEGRAVDLQQPDVGHRPRRGGARQVLQHRHLAEEVPLLQQGEDLLLVADLVQDLDLAVVDDVHLGPEVPLAEDVVALLDLDQMALPAGACGGRGRAGVGAAGPAGGLEDWIRH